MIITQLWMWHLKQIGQYHFDIQSMDSRKKSPYTKQFWKVQSLTFHCANLIMATITSHIFTDIFPREPLQLHAGNEKHMASFDTKNLLMFNKSWKIWLCSFYLLHDEVIIAYLNFENCNKYVTEYSQTGEGNNYKKCLLQTPELQKVMSPSCWSWVQAFIHILELVFPL